ncbi:MAG: hypothetical protein ACOC8N_04430, partial [Spirochaetota bacterium]
GLSFACLAVREAVRAASPLADVSLPPGNALSPPAHAVSSPGNGRGLEELLGRWHPPLFALKAAVQALNQLGRSGGVEELIQRHRVLAGLLDGKAARVRDGIPYPALYGPETRNRLLERGIYGPLHRSHPFSVSLVHSPELLERCAREINLLF